MIGPVSRPAPLLSAVHVWLIAVFAVTLALGYLGIGVARPIFIAGCFVAGYYAWREAPARHLEVSLILFAVAPFLRRVVDDRVGFDPSGYMLIGPLLAILVPGSELRHMFGSRRAPSPALPPMVLMGVCIAYAFTITIAQGEFAGALAGGLKWGAPLIYGAWLLHRAQDDATLVQSAARTFLFVTPIIGAYGVFQYVAPPSWDRYWMVYAQMTSIGVPEPFGVRVFSTMNSPSSFATYAATGLLLFGFCRSGWQATIMAIPCSLGLLLSLYRTAWLGLAVGIIFCFFFAATRGRSIMMIILLVVAISGAALNDTIGDVIVDRLQTLANAPSEDGSGQERIQEYLTLYENAERTLFGDGMASAAPSVASQMPVDGLIVFCWMQMGIIVGLICIIATIWVAVVALIEIKRRPDPIRIVLGAVIVGALAELPLSTITVGELGFLFWVCVALAISGKNSKGPQAAGVADPAVRAFPVTPATI